MEWFFSNFLPIFQILGFNDIRNRKLQAPSDLRFGAISLKNFNLKKMIQLSQGFKLLSQENNRSVIIMPIGYIALKPFSYYGYNYTPNDLLEIFQGQCLAICALLAHINSWSQCPNRTLISKHQTNLLRKQWDVLRHIHTNGKTQTTSGLYSKF